MHRRSTKQVYFEVIALQELITLLDIKKKACQEILLEINAFEERPSKLDMPQILATLYRSGMMAAKNSGRERTLLQYDAAHYPAFKSCPGITIGESGNIPLQVALRNPS